MLKPRPVAPQFRQTNSLATQRARSYPAFRTPPASRASAPWRRAPGTQHRRFRGVPTRCWAVMKFIHDEAELTWLNNTPENTPPIGFRGSGAPQRSTRVFFLHRLPRSRSDHPLAAYPFLPPVRRRRKQTRSLSEDVKPLSRVAAGQRGRGAAAGGVRTISAEQTPGLVLTSVIFLLAIAPLVR